MESKSSIVTPVFYVDIMSPGISILIKMKCLYNSIQLINRYKIGPIEEWLYLVKSTKNLHIFRDRYEFTQHLIFC